MGNFRSTNRDCRNYSDGVKDTFERPGWREATAAPAGFPGTGVEEGSAGDMPPDNPRARLGSGGRRQTAEWGMQNNGTDKATSMPPKSHLKAC